MKPPAPPGNAPVQGDELSDATKLPDDSPERPKRRRGRPLKNPDLGPESTAARAATHRHRTTEEMKALAFCLWRAMLTIRRLGGQHDVATLFHAGGGKGLEAVRRVNPRMAAGMKKMTAECRAISDEFFNRIHGMEVEPGRAKVSIRYGDHEFVAGPDGTVLRDGKPTEYRISRGLNSCSVENFRRSEDRRVHYNQEPHRMALLDVAMILAERETGVRVSTPNPYTPKARPPEAPKRRRRQA